VLGVGKLIGYINFSRQPSMSNQEDFSDDIINGGFGSEENRMSGGGDDMYGNGGEHGHESDPMGGGDGMMDNSGDHGYGHGHHSGHYGGGGDAPGPGKDDDRYVDSILV